MDHEAHVGLVDAHAEGVGGDHHPELVREPLLLPARALRVAQSAVVGRGGDALLAQQVGDLLGPFARADVDDARAGDVAQQPEQLAVLVVGAADAVGEVGSGEAAPHDVRLGELQVAHDVLRHGIRRRGREGQYRDAREPFAQLGDAQVRGAEVVAPLRDAVGLVDGQQRDVHPHDAQPEGLRREALGCHVEELHVAVDAVVERDVDLARREPRVDRHGGDAAGPQAVDLILHQGDERRDDDAQTLARHRRDLIGQRLAASGGHQGERVAPLHGGADDPLLHGTELREAPPAAQRVVDSFRLFARFHTAKVTIFRRGPPPSPRKTVRGRGAGAPAVGTGRALGIRRRRGKRRGGKEGAEGGFCHVWGCGRSIRKAEYAVLSKKIHTFVRS